MVNLSFVVLEDIMNKDKKCSKCKELKDSTTDFYKCSGVYRPECKDCTKKHVSKYQIKNKVWLTRVFDRDKKTTYQRDYYKKNPDKYVKYRENAKNKKRKAPRKNLPQH